MLIQVKDINNGRNRWRRMRDTYRTFGWRYTYVRPALWIKNSRPDAYSAFEGAANRAVNIGGQPFGRHR